MVGKGVEKGMNMVGKIDHLFLGMPFGGTGRAAIAGDRAYIDLEGPRILRES